MIEAEETIAYCHSCGEPMDVTSVAPFTNVECPTCGKHTRVKREFGPYTLMKRHAAGGMSMVFSAHDNTLDREVAVKILSENYSADERRITAFEQEARLTASFGHPHVVKVFTTGRAFGRFYIAMEFVPGGHFEHQIRERGKIPEEEMLRLAVEVAQGLKAAQSAGLIHRDVKPGNILLDAEGHAKLVDFGLALVTHGGMAQATELWATPYYVPPETVEGHPEDFRSDIYAFGATLYHALAGKPPCDEESMASDVLREAKKRVVPLASSDPSISAATCRMVDRAMAYRPEDRFSSYDEMITAIQQSLHFIKTGRTELNAAARRSLKKRRERVMLISTAAAILLLGAAAALWPSRKKTVTIAVPTPPATVSENPLGETAITSPPSQPDATAAIAQTYRQAHASLESGDYDTASRSFLALFRNPAVQEPSRSWAGVEAAITHFLNGKSTDARQIARETVTHIQLLPPETHNLGKNLIETLERLNGLRPVATPSADPAAAGAPQLVATMIAALKNWDQGMLAPAAAGFREATAISLPQDHAWAAIYQKLAAHYLADYETLTSPLFESLPNTPAECDKAIDALNAAQATLKTRGRSRFNVRSWQIDLARHRKLLNSQQSTPAAPEPVSLTEIMARLDVFARECRYHDATEFLKKLPDDPVIPARLSLLALTTAATSFITDLQAELAKAPVAVELTLRNGEEITSLRYDLADGLIATAIDEKPRQIRWSDLYPDAAITLHQKFLATYPGDPFDLLRRNKGAIAHGWLAGERERAINAAGRLSATNPSFAAEWEKNFQDLPK